MLPYISLFVFRNDPQKKLALLMQNYQGTAAKARPLQNRLSALRLIWQRLDLEYKEKAEKELRKMEFRAQQKQATLQHELKEQIEATQRAERQLANFNQPLQPTSKKARTAPQVTSTATVEEIFEDSGELY